MPNNLEIEIVDFSAIAGGIEVFARATRNGVQIGFGIDGSIDVERFLIYNPPILVQDPLGDIVKTYTDDVTGAPTVTVTQREDPQEALLQALERTINAVPTSGPENIVAGKRGSTTTSAYTSSDASIYVGDASYATAHNASSGTARNLMAQSSNIGGPFYYIERAFFVFDVSSIPDTDVISATTLNLFGGGASTDANGFTANVYSSTCADTVTGADYGSAGTTPYVTTDITSGNWNTASNNALAFNSTGIAGVSKTGKTKVSVRIKNFDADNSAPANANQLFMQFMEDANDPQIVVTHAAAPSVNGNFLAFM